MVGTSTILLLINPLRMPAIKFPGCTCELNLRKGKWALIYRVQNIRRSKIPNEIMTSENIAILAFCRKVQFSGLVILLEKSKFLVAHRIAFPGTNRNTAPTIITSTPSATVVPQ